MAKYMVLLTALIISSATAQLSHDLSLHSENLVRMFSDYLLSDEQNFQLQRETRGVELDGCKNFKANKWDIPLTVELSFFLGNRCSRISWSPLVSFSHNFNSLKIFKTKLNSFASSTNIEPNELKCFHSKSIFFKQLILQDNVNLVNLQTPSWVRGIPLSPTKYRISPCGTSPHRECASVKRINPLCFNSASIHQSIVHT